MLAAILGVGRSALIAHDDRPLAESTREARWAALARRGARPASRSPTCSARRNSTASRSRSNADVLVPRPGDRAAGRLGAGAARRGARCRPGRSRRRRPVGPRPRHRQRRDRAGPEARSAPTLAVSASDVSAEALAVARRNADRLGLAIELRRIVVVAGVGGAPLRPRRRQSALHRRRRPASGGVAPRAAAALTPGGDGLDALRAIVAGAPAHLRPGGWLLVEHGFDQGRGGAGAVRRRRLGRRRRPAPTSPATSAPAAGRRRSPPCANRRTQGSPSVAKGAVAP